MYALTRQHYSRLHQFFVEIAHRRKQFGAGKHAGLGILVRLHDHHHSHFLSPFGFGPETGPFSAALSCLSLVCRTRIAQIDIATQFFSANYTPPASPIRSAASPRIKRLLIASRLAIRNAATSCLPITYSPSTEARFAPCDNVVKEMKMAYQSSITRRHRSGALPSHLPLDTIHSVLIDSPVIRNSHNPCVIKYMKNSDRKSLRRSS